MPLRDIVHQVSTVELYIRSAVDGRKYYIPVVCGTCGWARWRRRKLITGGTYGDAVATTDDVTRQCRPPESGLPPNGMPARDSGSIRDRTTHREPSTRWCHARRLAALGTYSTKLTPELAPLTASGAEQPFECFFTAHEITM
jgi:hypothetical protein